MYTQTHKALPFTLLDSYDRVNKSAIKIIFLDLEEHMYVGH